MTDIVNVVMEVEYAMVSYPWKESDVEPKPMGTATKVTLIRAELSPEGPDKILPAASAVPFTYNVPRETGGTETMTIDKLCAGMFGSATINWNGTDPPSKHVTVPAGILVAFYIFCIF